MVKWLACEIDYPKDSIRIADCCFETVRYPLMFTLYPILYTDEKLRRIKQMLLLSIYNISIRNERIYH